MTSSRATARPRLRRSGAQLREAILAAARELFGQHGFADATTRDIARRAGVAEQSVYSHFGNKQGLYEAAVLDPFTSFVEQFTVQWRDAATEIDSLEELMSRYTKGLYAVSVENRDVLRALPAGYLDKLATRGPLDIVEAWVTPLARRGGYHFDPRIAVRSVFVLVTTLAMLGDDLLPGVQPDDVVAEVTHTLLHGLLRR